MGLPIVISPVYSRSLPWLVLSPLVSPLLLKAPFGLGSWVRYNRYMWVLEERASAFQDKGKMFVVVSPGKIQVRYIWIVTDQSDGTKLKAGVLGGSRRHKTSLSQEEGLRAQSTWM